MATITVVSEPLIEQFGEGYTEADERPETPCSGDGLNMASAIHRMLARLQEYPGTPLPSTHNVGLFCGLGGDERGETIARFMRQEGLDTSNIITLPEYKTGAYTIKKPKGGGRSADYHDRDHTSAIRRMLEDGPHQETTTDVLDKIKANTDVLVITGIGASCARSESAFQKLVDTAVAVRKKGGTVIVDFNHRFDAETGDAKLWMDDATGKPLPNDLVRTRMDQLFAIANLSFVAHDELWPVYGEAYSPKLGVGQEPSDGAPIVQYLRNLTPPLGCEGTHDVFFKRGKDGGTLYRKDDKGNDVLFATRGRVVIAKERNGGGDALIGGTIAALQSGFTLEEALNIGQTTAAQVIQHLGGVIRKDHLPTDAMIDEALGMSEEKTHAETPALADSAASSRDSRPAAPQNTIAVTDSDRTGALQANKDRGSPTLPR